MGEVTVATLAAASQTVPVDLVDNPLRAVGILEARWIDCTTLTVAFQSVAEY